MRMIIINATLIVVAYAIPNVIVFYLQGKFNKSLLEFALAISWSLKIVGYANSFINSIVAVYTEIVSFGRLEFFLKNRKIEETEKKKLYSLSRKLSVYDAVVKRVHLNLAGRSVIEDFNLALQNGEKVALIGESGSGKHLFFNLLMKIYEREQKDEQNDSFDSMIHNSSIEVLGYDLDDVNAKEIREKVAYLDKKAVVYRGTVRENINPDFEHEDDAILSVMRKLDSVRIIQNLEKRDDDKQVSGVEKNRNETESVSEEDLNIGGGEW